MPSATVLPSFLPSFLTPKCEKGHEQSRGRIIARARGGRLTLNASIHPPDEASRRAGRGGAL